MACGMSPRVGASPEAGSMAMKWLAKGKCLIDEPPWPFLMTRQHLQWARLVRKCGRPCGSAPPAPLQAASAVANQMARRER